MRQYSIDKVEITWADLDFKEGLAQGTSVVEARTAPTYTVKPTGTGKVVRVYNPDRSGTVSITVDQESQLHKDLRLIAIADVLNRDQVFPMLITDGSTGETFLYSNAFIQTEPDETRGTESATFTWVFMFESVRKLNGLADTNLVGD